VPDTGSDHRQTRDVDRGERDGIGKIKLLRESVNLVEVALGVLPNGLADYKVPSEHEA